VVEPVSVVTFAVWVSQLDFFKRYNAATGSWGVGFSCVRKALMNRLGAVPSQFSSTDDAFMFYQVSLFGGVVFFESPLVAYRVSETSVSANRLRTRTQMVDVFQKLQPKFQESEVKGLREAFQGAYAGQHRYYAKLLLGAGKPKEARHQLLRSIAVCHQPASVGKSLAILAATWLPGFLQPRWPSAMRANTVQVARPRAR
jgi:hypothetical protein